MCVSQEKKKPTSSYQNPNIPIRTWSLVSRNWKNNLIKKKTPNYKDSEECLFPISIYLTTFVRCKPEFSFALGAFTGASALCQIDVQLLCLDLAKMPFSNGEYVISSRGLQEKI